MKKQLSSSVLADARLTSSLGSSESLEHQDGAGAGEAVLAAHGVSQYETIEPIDERDYQKPWISEFKGRDLPEMPDDVETLKATFSFKRALFFKR